MAMMSWLRSRFGHLWKITRLGWFVSYEIIWLFLYLNADAVITSWGSPRVKTFWEHYKHPNWGWKNYLIGALLVAIIFLIEGSFRVSQLQDQNWDDTRRGIEFTHSQIVRDFSEKMDALKGELADEKAKQKAPNIHLEWKVLPQKLAGLGTHAFFLTNGGHADAFNVGVTFKEMDGFSAIHKDCVNKIAVGASEILLCYPMKVDPNHKHSYLGGMKAAGLETLLTAMEQGNAYPISELEIAYKDVSKKDYADRFVVTLDDPFGIGNSVTIRKL